MATDVWELLGLTQPGPGDPGFQRAGQPLITTLPQATRSFTNKWQSNPFLDIVGGFNPQAQKALVNYDLDRVRRGQNVLPAADSVKAGFTADTKQAATPAEDRSVLDIPGNAVKDLTQIVKSLPQLPKIAVEEVKDFTDGLTDDYAEMDKAGIDSGIGRIANLPLVRMLVPGTYVAGNLAEGNVDELAKHPLLTALDVLPFASKLASGSKVVKAAEAARLNEIAAKGANAYAPKVRPLKTIATRTLDDAGEVVPNALGEGINRIAESRAGQAVGQAFGGKTREAARDTVLAEHAATGRLLSPAADDTVGNIGNQFYTWATDKAALMERFGIDRAREAELYKVATRGDEAEIGRLSTQEQQFLKESRAASEQMADHLVETGELAKYGDEVYTPADARRLERAEVEYHNATVKLMGGNEILRRSGNVREVPGVYDTLVKAAAQNEGWAKVQELIDAGDLAGAKKKVTDAKNWGGLEGITDQQLLKLRTRIEEAAKKEAKFRTIREVTSPARFDELIVSKAADNMISRLADEGVITDVAQAQRFAEQGILDQIPGFTRNSFRAEANAIRRNWQTLKAEGANPIFLQRVSAKRANNIGRVHFDGSVPTLQSAKARVADVSPAQNSISVAIAHQAQDIIQREVGQQLAQHVAAKWGVPESQVFEKVAGRMEELAARDPRYGLDSARAELIRRGWVPYEPNKLFPFAGEAKAFPNVTANGERIFIPKQVADFYRAANAEGFSRMRVYSDPLTRVWRTSLLALSPRWHLYNITGGMVMTLADQGPRAFENMRLAAKVAREAKAGKPLSVALPDEVRRVLGQIGHEEAELAFKRGMAARTLQDSGAFQKGKAAIQWSYDMNAMVDDFYRVTAYLSGEKAALAKYTKMGFNPAEAKNLATYEGIQAARKVLQDTAALSPVERSVFRQVVPFYAWLSHLLRFVFQYPMDHPWRTAILANASEIAMDDLGSGGTTDMLDELYLGEPDAEGNQQRVRVGSLNPFGDVGNLFSFAGWLGQAHPLFKVAAQQLGIDSRTNMSSLYPTTTYDPVTGKEIVDTGNPVTAFARASVPQLDAAWRLLGLDPKHNDYAMSDPTGASRAIQSGFGLPTGVMPRAANPLSEYIMAEVVRQKTSKQSNTNALKSGDIASLPPEWQPIIQKALESGALDENIQPPRR